VTPCRMLHATHAHICDGACMLTQKSSVGCCRIAYNELVSCCWLLIGNIQLQTHTMIHRHPAMQHTS
jgi:hypothetical protein